MGSPRLSLNIRVPWDGVLAALQLPLHSKALPVRTRCPVCGADALHIYHDNVSGGAWHHCNKCGTNGDMIELAANTWDCSAHVALHRLADSGVGLPDECLNPDAIAIYVAQYPGYRERMNTLWADAKARYPKTVSPDIQRIRRQHNLRLDVSHDRWNAGPGHLFGVAHSSLIEKAFHPAHKGTSEWRVFRSGKWHDVLLVPFYDMPDRIRSFALLGRSGRIPQDFVFRQLTTASTTGHDTGRWDAGLAGVPSIALAGNPDYVLVVDDWMLMLQMHLRTVRSSKKPLPVVAWSDAGNVRPLDSWRCLEGREAIFWMPKMRAAALAQAIEADGQLAMVGPVEGHRAMLHYLRLHPGHDMARLLRANAMPWPEALRRWLRTASESETHQLWIDLEQRGVDAATIFRAGKVKGEFNIPLPARQIEWGAGRIIEQGDAWFSVATRRVAAGRREVLNCILRITHAIKDKGSGEMFYFGRIRYRGQEIRFIERLENVTKSTATWLNAKLAEAGLGVLSWNNGMAKDLHQIAVLFQEPEFVVDDLWRWREKLETPQI